MLRSSSSLSPPPIFALAGLSRLQQRRLVAAVVACQLRRRPSLTAVSAVEAAAANIASPLSLSPVDAAAAAAGRAERPLCQTRLYGESINNFPTIKS